MLAVGSRGGSGERVKPVLGAFGGQPVLTRHQQQQQLPPSAAQFVYTARAAVRPGRRPSAGCIMVLSSPHTRPPACTSSMHAAVHQAAPAQQQHNLPLRLMKSPSCMLLPSQADLRLLQRAACDNSSSPSVAASRQLANHTTSSKRILAAGTLPAQQQHHNHSYQHVVRRDRDRGHVLER